MKVLVTGGAGFIGSHTVDRLIARDHEVTVLDNLDPQVHGDGGKTPANLQAHLSSKSLRFIHGDVRDRDTVAAALVGIDAVVHLAAAVGVGQSMYKPSYYTDVNVAGQGRLLEEMVSGAKRYRRLVVASSMSIYGEGAYLCEQHGVAAPPPRLEAQLAKSEWELLCSSCGRTLQRALTKEDKPLQSTSIYAVTKKTQEELALCFGRAYRIPTIALRFFNVYGSRQALSNPYTGVAAIFLSRLKNGKAPLVFEDGKQSRDFIHVGDVARAVVQAVEGEDAVWDAYNVCTGNPVTISQVGTALARRLGLKTQPGLVGKYRAGDIRHCVGDPGRARQLMRFEATTTFEAGLDELIAWSERQRPVDRVEASLAELEKQGLVR